MRNFLILAASALVCGVLMFAQRSGDWATFGGDTQRTGWERSDAAISKDSVKNFQLLYKMKLDGPAKGPRSLTPPAILGNLISYRGFKELAFVGGSADYLYVINADLGNVFWQRQFSYSSDIPRAKDDSGPCGGGITAVASLVSGFSRPAGRGAAGRGAEPGGRAPEAGRRGPATPAGDGRGAAPARGAFGGGGFGAPRPVYVLTSDGRLHRLNTANGDDVYPSVKFLPPNAKASNLAISSNVIYATTNQGCGSVPNGVWALDLNEAEPEAHSYISKNGGFWGLAGPVIGLDGVVYAQAGDGTLLALNPGDLSLLRSFRPPDINPAAQKNLGMNAASPVVFNYKDREVIVASGKDARLYLLDGETMSEMSHTAPLSTSETGGVWGGLSSWQDADGVRWVLAPVWGPNGSAPNGSIVAFKIEEQNDKPVLRQAWISRDMSSPAPAVIASGVVFALSAGEYTRQAKEGWTAPILEERAKSGAHAILYALDGATGKELYSTRNQVTAPAALTGLTVANGRVYFGATDGAFYAFGIYMEH